MKTEKITPPKSCLCYYGCPNCLTEQEMEDRRNPPKFDQRYKNGKKDS